MTSNMGRPPIGEEPMTRRNLYLPDELWVQLQAQAAAEGYKVGRPVSVSEVVRQILERSMKRRGK